jgi:hypothetical protein
VKKVNDVLGLPNVEAMGVMMCLHAEKKSEVAKVLHSKHRLKLGYDGVQGSRVSASE